MRTTTIFLLLLIMETTLGFAAETNRAPVTRVINMCYGKMSEINVSALQDATEILKTSHPELAAELQKMAKESIG